jgi:hypothetical protein
MTASPERALLKGLRELFISDPGVRALLGEPVRLYDQAPPEPDYPYATLGDVQSRPLDTDAAPALEHAVSVHVWSRHEGKAEALDALSALRGALSAAPIAASGRRIVHAVPGYFDVFRAGDGRTIHGVLRIRIVSEPI